MTTDSESISVIFELSDGYVSTIVTNSLLTVTQKQTAPTIHLGNGLTQFTIYSDSTSAITPFPQIIVSDTDEGGGQFVSATLTVDPPGYLNLSNVSGLGALLHPADLTTLLRGVTCLPNPVAMQSMPVNSEVNATIYVIATDKKGMPSPPRSISVTIQKKNAAPVLDVPQDQPVFFSPSLDIVPFGNVGLSNDDDRPMTFTFTMDANKGTFDGTSGFTPSGNGFTITASVVDILAALANVTFKVSSTYGFGDRRHKHGHAD